MLKNTCCSICLSINNRTINIYDTDLRYVYETLANFKISDNECWMCYICHTRLRQCHQLQQLAVQTRGLIDDIFQNKVDIKYRAYGSLLKLSNSKTKIMCTTQHIKQESDGVTEFYYDNNVQLNEYVELNKTKKNISTTPNCSYIEQDVKREVCSDNEVEQDEIVKNEEETFAMAPEDPILGEQESNVESDAQKVLKLKLNELSQSVIDKCFGQSPSTHPVTEIYIEDTGNRAWGEQSNAEVKLEIETEDKGTSEEPAVPLSHRKRKGSILSVAEQSMTLKAYEFVHSTWPEDKYRSNRDMIVKTAEITGVSVRSIYRLLKEYRETGELQPKNRKKKKITIWDKLDDSKRSALRHKVHGLFVEGRTPNLNKILQSINEDAALPNFSKTTLRRVLQKLEFKFQFS